LIQDSLKSIENCCSNKTTSIFVRIECEIFSNYLETESESIFLHIIELGKGKFKDIANMIFIVPIFAALNAFQNLDYV